MALQICVLGSGSGGNSTLLRIQEDERTHHVLIDAGLSPKETQKRLHTLHISIEDIDSILLTHLHADHFRDSWLNICKHQEIRVFFHRKHARLWWKKKEYGVPTTEFHIRFFLTQKTSVRPFLLPHDRQWSTGFLIEHNEVKVGYMTDLGHVPDEAYRHFKGMDTLAIESNYDPRLQANSPRPPFLKQRIMGPNGHLSNEQSLLAVRRFAAHSGLGQILLLHPSQQCNTPDHIRELYTREAPHLLDRVHITEQDAPSPLFTVLPSSPANNLVEEDILPPQLDLF